MDRPPMSRHTIALAVSGAIILPVAICLIMAVASLLSAMGDAAGGGVLHWVALGCGIIWAINLILLVLALAINALSNPDDSNSEEK